MTRSTTLGFGFLAVLGAAMSITSIIKSGNAYHFAYEDDMVAHGVTSKEMIDLVEAYEKRVKRRGGRLMGANTKADRQVYIAVTTSQAPSAEILLKGVMCPSGVSHEKVECDYQFSSAHSGVLCDANNAEAGYVIGLTLTASQRSVLAKWSQGFSVAHIVSVPLRDMRNGSVQFWSDLAAMGYRKCQTSGTPDGNL